MTSASGTPREPGATNGSTFAAPVPQEQPDSETERPSCDVAEDKLTPTAIVEPSARRTTWVLPEDFISRCTAMVLLLCVYSALCIWVPTSIGMRANPSIAPDSAKPVWNLLFLYEYVRRVPPLIGALTPAVMLLALGALPFLDRNPSRQPRTRAFAFTLAGVTVAAILVLTYLGSVG